MYIIVEFSSCAVLQLVNAWYVVKVQIVSMVCNLILFAQKLVFYSLKSERLVSCSYL